MHLERLITSALIRRWNGCGRNSTRGRTSSPRPLRAERADATRSGEKRLSRKGTPRDRAPVRGAFLAYCPGLVPTRAKSRDGGKDRSELEASKGAIRQCQNGRQVWNILRQDVHEVGVALDFFQHRLSFEQLQTIKHLFPVALTKRRSFFGTIGLTFSFYTVVER